MSGDRPTRYRFGDCVLDVNGRQLLLRGEAVALQPRVFDLLVFLIENRDRAVDKDELQDAVWRPMIVSETALTRAIMKARRAVGDDAGQQAVIRTVHGHGYQFIAPLEEDDAAASAGDAETPATPPAEADRALSAGEASRDVARWRLSLGLGALLAIAVVVVAIVSRVPADAADIRLAVLPVTNATDDAEYDWARLGLMGLANDLFDETGSIDTVAASDIVRFVDDLDWRATLEAEDTDDAIGRLRDGFGATHVLFAELQPHVGGLRLNYTLVGADGKRVRSTMVSDATAPLVRGMVRGVSQLLGTHRYPLPEDGANVDADPFINEAYARAIGTALEGRCLEALPLFDVVLARNPDLVRARILRADCRFELGETQAAEQAFEALLARDDVAGDDSLRAEILRRLGVLEHRSGRHAEAERSYAEARQAAEAAGDKEMLARALISTAILAKDRRQFDAARELLARATLKYRQLEWNVLPGAIPSTLANIAMNDGQLDAAEQHLIAALSSYRAIGDRAGEARMLNNYGFLRRLQGRFSEAEPLHLQSLELRREIGDRVGQGRILNFLSILYQRDKRHDEARDAAAEAVAIAREASDRLFLATGLAQLAAAERDLGNTDAALAAYTESGRIFREIEDVSRALQVELRLARLDIEQGALDAAESRVEAVLDQALNGDMPEPAIEAMRYLGDLALRREDSDTASKYFERGLEHVDATGFESLRAPLAERLAALYLDAGNAGAAEPLLGYLTGQEPTAYRVMLQARHARMTGDSERATALMLKAKALAGDLWSADDEATLNAYQAVGTER